MNVFYLVNPFFNIHNTPSSSFQLTSTCLFLLLSSALFKYSNLPSTFFPSYPGAAHVFERSKLPAFQHFGTRFLYPTVMNCYATVTNPIRQLLALCDSYEPYPTVINASDNYQRYWQLSVLYDSYQLYAAVISSIRQLSALCHSNWPYATVMSPTDSYRLYATVTSPIRQLLALCDSYQSYWQLWALCDSYQSYPPVTTSMRQLSVLSDSY